MYGPGWPSGRSNDNLVTSNASNLNLLICLALNFAASTSSIPILLISASIPSSDFSPSS
uniref:Uncharacterized protein n=1 Tax=Rhizophora mucronata TaxID=61149 RepID=A0A2P2PVV7_RHIMU